MGEAKRKKLACVAPVDYSSGPQLDTIKRAASAVARIMRATGIQRGQDCTLQAVMLSTLLNEQGIPACPAVGYAAWRVGPGDGDMVAHHPSAQMMSEGNFSGHAWVRIGRMIVDSTIWQLPHKLAVLDAMDGRCSVCTWTAEYIVIDRSNVTPFWTLTQRCANGSFYEERPELAGLLTKCAPSDDDMNAARFAFENPDLRLFGIGDAIYSPDELAQVQKAVEAHHVS